MTHRHIVVITKRDNLSAGFLWESGGGREGGTEVVCGSSLICEKFRIVFLSCLVEFEAEFWFEELRSLVLNWSSG
jgi:hypothetical protein